MVFCRNSFPAEERQQAVSGRGRRGCGVGAGAAGDVGGVDDALDDDEGARGRELAGVLGRG
jgi:hypothetical protein